MKHSASKASHVLSKPACIKALALKLLNMNDEDFYNHFWGYSNPTGKKRLKELREILAFVANEARK